MNGNKKNNYGKYGLDVVSDDMHGFFFIKPKEGTSANELASKLIGIDGLEEVRVREGTIGYSVLAKFKDVQYSEMEQKMPKAAGQQYGRFVSAMKLKNAMK